MHKIVVFSGSNCSACDRLKDWLNSQNVKFDQIDVETNQTNARNYGIRSVPTAIKFDGEVELGRIVGFQLNEVKKFVGVS